MTYPKIKPCPICDPVDQMDVYSYENGWKHVECDRCFYLGPGEGRILQAIRSHNSRRDEEAAAYATRAALSAPYPRQRKINKLPPQSTFLLTSTSQSSIIRG